MSDVIDGFRAMREHQRQENQQNKETNLAALQQGGVAFKSTNFGETLVFREAGKPKVDFYPSTGRWRIVGDPQNKRTMRGGAAAFLTWYEQQEKK